MSLVVSDWPGLSHVITQDPIAVAGAVTYRLTPAMVGARVDGTRAGQTAREARTHRGRRTLGREGVSGAAERFVQYPGTNAPNPLQKRGTEGHPHVRGCPTSLVTRQSKQDHKEIQRRGTECHPT